MKKLFLVLLTVILISIISQTTLAYRYSSYYNYDDPHKYSKFRSPFYGSYHSYFHIPQYYPYQYYPKADFVYHYSKYYSKYY